MQRREAVAFVAGATGYTGREVVRQLAQRGTAVHAHVRLDSARLDEWRERFAAWGAQVDATPWDAASVRAAFDRIQPTHVFALLGTTRRRSRTSSGGATPDTYEAVDYGLTAMLLHAATACGSGPRFVYLSAVGAREDAGSRYMALRGRLEREVRESGLGYTIARPSFITGAGRDDGRRLERAAAALLDAILAVLGALGARTLRARYRSMTNVEVAAGLIRWSIDCDGSHAVVETADLRAAHVLTADR